MDDAQNTTARHAALHYHENPKPGKLEIRATKPLANGRDLSLAYSPGVAEACLEIKADPANARRYTSRGNLVAVVSNGTAVLGLGNIGALAAKPVMEGKAVLFKKFANIDCFDIELNEPDPQKLAEIVCALEPTFGAINLEDIKAPDCFIVEQYCRERMNIPVFHDDQHGTAIVVGAAATNALIVAKKRFDEIKVVSTGGGAAGIACLEMLVKLGVRRENVWLCDLAGLVYHGRAEQMTPQKAAFAQGTAPATLQEVIQGADLFLGLSGPGVLTPAMVARMAPRPIVFALANPTPEILPDEVRSVAPDAIIATGRSDFPNQVNNVLCFPFIFRGALDVGATTINEEMKLACVKAIAELAEAEASDIVASAYGGQELSFGAEYIIPKPFDPRLIVKIAPAVAKAAMDSGVATKPIADFDAYVTSLNGFVYQSGIVMKPVFSAAKAVPMEQKRVIYAEGEDERVLHAVRVVLDEGLARPILIGRPEVIEMRIKKIGLNLVPERDFEVVNPESDPRYRELWTEYYKLMSRDGVTPDVAKAKIRRDTTLIGIMLLRRGDADAMVCGTFGTYDYHLKQVADVIGLAPGAKHFAAMNLLLLTKRMLAVTDTYVNENPSAEEVAEIARMAADELRRFGIEPNVALLSHSNFGSSNSASARKMRRACEILHATCPNLNVDGEMHGDAALSVEMRDKLHPDSRLKGEANLLVMPNLDAANISFNLMKMANGDGVSVGPILLGAAKPVHIVTPSATVRRLVNMTALAVVDAQASRAEQPA